MSNRKKTATKLEHILLPRELMLRVWDSWEYPSLIPVLTGKQRHQMRETFDVHLEDFDIHMRKVEECWVTGSAIDDRPRPDKRLRIQRLLNRVEEGIFIQVHLVAMTHNVPNPLFDENGYPRKLTFEWMIPANMVPEMTKVTASMVIGIGALNMALWAKDEGDEKTFVAMGRSLEHFSDCIAGVDHDAGKATIEDAMKAKVQETEKKSGKKGKRAKLAADSADEQTADAAREVVTTATGTDPGAGTPEGATVTDETSFADLTTPAPTASAAPTPAAPKASKKERAPKIKLGSPEAAAKLTELSGTPPTDGSNGQN